MHPTAPFRFYLLKRKKSMDQFVTCQLGQIDQTGNLAVPQIIMLMKLFDVEKLKISP